MISIENVDFRERSTRGSRALHARVVATFDNAFLQSVCMRTDAWLVDQTRGKHRKPTVLANDCDHSTPMIIKTVIKHSNIMPTDNSHHSLLPNFVCPHSLSLTGVDLNPYPGLSHDFLASGWVGISLSQPLITVSRQNNVFLTEKACEHAVQGTGNTKPARRPSSLKTKLPSPSQINFYITAYTAYVSSPTLTIYHAEASNPQRVLQPSKKRVKGCECLGH